MLLSFLGMPASLLPWSGGTSFGYIYGYEGDGIITFCIFLICFILTLSGKISHSVRKGQLTFVIIICGIAGLFCIFNIFNLDILYQPDIRYHSKQAIKTSSAAYGLRITTIISFLIIIVALVSMSVTKKKKKLKRKRSGSIATVPVSED